MPPKVTVLMPVYNNISYVGDAIESVLNQTFSNFEFLILNDGSTDGSDIIIEDFARKDDRIVFFNDTLNKGLIYRLNQGFKYAKGEYLARIDGDDICDLTRFEKQVNFLDSNPFITVCSSNYEFIGSLSGKTCLPLNDEDIRISLLEKCVIAHPLVMLRRAFFIENKFEYNLEAVAAEDYDLWSRIVDKACFANLPDILLKYRIYPDQVSSKNADLQRNNSDRCRIRMLSYIWQIRTEEDHRLAQLIVRPSLVKDYYESEKLLKLLDKLLCNNEDIQFYNLEKFSKYIKDKKRSIIRYYYQNKKEFNPKSLKLHFGASDNFRHSLSRLDNIVLIIKCLIFYKKQR